ncbi:MAG: hypothetical protein ACRBBP_05545 [Bdellovibrionales bacterium]
MRILSILIPILFLFTACEEVAEVAARKGSTESGSGDSPTTTPITTDEVITDAWDLPFAIEGITYTRADGTQGTTTADGQITCTQGESIIFSIGSIVLGTTECSDNITIEDIAGVDSPTDDEAVQLTLLLLSLDNDDDPNNGINIVDTATDYTGTTTLDLTDPTAVADLIQEIDPGTAVIPTTEVDDIIEEAEQTENAPTVISNIWDTPIEGLTYSTPSGGIQTTGESGLIFCVEGETITFSIGALELATIPCSAGMTIADLAGTENPTDDEAVQLALILLSLDEDGNPDNGIQISDTATGYTGETTTVDLTDPTDVAEVIQEVNPGTSVIPTLEVIEVINESTPSENTTPVVSNIWNIPIEGLSYSSPSGGNQTTGPSGLIMCAEGENVTFSMGSLQIASLSCTAGMTLADLAGTDNPTDAEALQLALILLSLDEDGNPDNGIQIADTATGYTGSSTLDLSDPAVIAALIQELNPGTPVIPLGEVTSITQVATGKRRGRDVTYTGSISSTTDLTGGLCPNGASSLTITKDDDVSLVIPTNLQAPVDFAHYLNSGNFNLAPETGLADITFDVPDPESDMNISDCTPYGGYTATVQVRFTDIPIESDPDSVSSSYEIYQICTDSTELPFCSGTFSGSK